MPREWPAASQQLLRGSLLPQPQCWQPLGTPRALPGSKMPSLKGKLMRVILTGITNGSEVLTANSWNLFKLNGKIILRANAETPTPMASKHWNGAVVIWYPIHLSLELNRIYWQTSEGSPTCWKAAHIHRVKGEPYSWVSSAKVHLLSRLPLQQQIY